MATTLADIARETKLSTSSVADVLRGRPGYSSKTQKRVLETARRLDYVPNHLARSLLMQASHTIGVAGALDNTAVTGAMLHAITKGLKEAGYMPLFADTAAAPAEQSVPEAVRELRARSVDGLILASGQNFCSDQPDFLPRELPCVSIHSADKGQPNSIIADHQQPLHVAVNWLADRGHRRIAFMGINNAQSAMNPFNTHQLKIKGYQQAMKDRGLYDPSLLLDADWHPGDVRQMVLDNAPQFRTLTAVIGSNDRVALEVINALKELGVRVPQDCSVIGFDNTLFAAGASPSLTTFEPNRQEVGKQAVNMLLKLIRGEKVSSITIVPELIHRSSAGPCPTHGKHAHV